MRKVLPIVLAALLAVTLVIAGCGKTTPKFGDAQKILEDSIKTMQSVTSYKATGNINMYSQAPEAGKMNFDYEMQIQRKGEKDFAGRMTMNSMGQDIDIYMVDGYAYTNDPEKGWTKQPLSDLSDFSTLASPSDISKLGNAAENTRILNEDSRYYNITFALSEDYITDLMGLEKGTENLSSEEKKVAQEMYEGMKMSAVLKIEKSTKYILGMAMSLTMPNIPAVGSMKMEMKTDYSEFNQPVEVTLPPEAQNAQEVTSSGTVTPSPVNP